MLRALELARRGQPTTAPNPNVGAVVVRGEECVGEGWHRAPGTPHAEVHALRAAGEAARGATLYVTLEPCCHTGRTGPCTELVLAAGIQRVVVGLVDPDPRVLGKGLDILRQAGLRVDLVAPALRRQCALANRFFLKARRTGTPFVTMKYAATLDGKIATRTGHSQWISGPEARAWVHEQRALHQAVLVGVGTVLADDPRLDVRLDGDRRQPVRLVADSLARTPPSARLFTTPAGPVVIGVTGGAPSSRVDSLRAAGAEVLLLPEAAGRLDLTAFCAELGRRELQSVLLEGGGALNAAMLEGGLVSRVAAFLAPRLIGGAAAPGPIGGLGAERLEQGWELQEVESRSVGKDLLIEGYLSCPWLTY
jgi:diaminohydroxyphosphoribosylaminopyrimidine deaminase/5-amino-6-(5-phosphoribosylamino)uracil reductase